MPCTRSQLCSIVVIVFGVPSAHVSRTDMVITVEPGCDFNRYLLTRAFGDAPHTPHLGSGTSWRGELEPGLREDTEDNVLITAEGRETFTSVPRTAEEIEASMAS